MSPLSWADGEGAGHRPAAPGAVGRDGLDAGWSDALHAIATSDYTANLTKPVWRIRTDRGTRHLPFVSSQIGPSSRFPACNQVTETQLRLSVQLIAAATVSTANLRNWQDHIHYTNDAWVEFGRHLARAYLTLVTSSAASAHRILRESPGEVPAG